MNPMLTFYKQTWWLWLLFVLVFAWLTYRVSALFVVMVPGIVLYSVYFGIIRTSELAEKEKADARRE